MNKKINKRHFHLKSISAMLIVLFSVIVSVAWAAPLLVNYQGVLSGPGILPNGTVDMTFRVFDADVGGTLFWEENQLGVQLNQGIYNVMLGEGTTTVGIFDVNLFADDNRWLEVEVNGEIFSPRNRIASSAYSFQSTEADNANTVGGQTAGDLTNYSDTAILGHQADPDAHHVKTTSFGELTDTATDAQIPDNITVDYAASAGNADTVDGKHASELGGGPVFGDTYWIIGQANDVTFLCKEGYVVDGFRRRCTNSDCQYGGSWEHRIRCRRIVP
jgi:hypothetical protein